MASLSIQERADLSDLFAQLEYARKPLALRALLCLKAFSKNYINKLNSHSSGKKILEFLHIKGIANSRIIKNFK